MNTSHTVDTLLAPHLGDLTELIVADRREADVVQLLGGATAEVCLIDAEVHALGALTLALHGRRIDTLHWVAHGRAGAVQWGGRWITSNDLFEQAALLAQWNVGTIALWSCEVGAAPDFVRALAQLTGARVQSTPSVLRGGPGFDSWQLTETALPNTEDGWGHALAFGEQPMVAPQLPILRTQLAVWPHTLGPTASFAKLMISSATGYNANTNNITLAAAQSAYTDVTFSQAGANTQFVNTSGNNIEGTLSYTVGGVTTTVTVTVSRLIKTIDGSSADTEAFYAYDAAGNGYLIITRSFDGQDHSSYFTAGQNYGTSGDPPRNDLNSYLNAASDTTAPRAPSIDLLATSDTGASTTDDKTADDTPTIRITLDQGAAGAEASDTVENDVVKLYAGGVLVGTATLTAADIANGYVDITASALAQGTSNFTATVTDIAGNVSPSSATLPVTIDTTAPAPAAASVTGTSLTLSLTESGTGLDAVNTGGTFSVLVNGNPVAVTGTAYSAANKTITLTLASSVPAGATVALSYNDPNDGVNDASVAQDVAGNDMADFTNFVVNSAADTTLTAGPLDMTNATDTGTSAEDELTANGLPVLTFPGEVGLTLTLRGPDGTLLTQGTHYSVSYAGGTYSVTLLDAQPGGAANPFGTFSGGAVSGNPASTSDGVYTIGATDTAGNTANVGTFTIDTTRPAVVPTVASQTTNDTTPLISGTATVAAGETLTVTVNGVTYTAGDGRLTLAGTNWSLQIPDAQALAAGTYAVTATVTDTAGNTTSDATTSELTIDTAVTAGPLDMTNATDSGSSAEDELTANGLPVLTFTGEPGLTLNLRGPDGTILTSGTHYSVAYAGGIYTVTLLDAQPGGTANPFGTYNSGYGLNGNPAATADGTYTIGATDPSGNTANVGTFVIDTTPPAIPGVNPQSTNDTTPVITGTAALAPGDTLSVTVNGVTYTADQGLLVNGSTWSLQIPASGAMAAGTYAVTATVTDLAGNESLDVTTGELIIDLGLTAGPLDMTNATDSGASPEDELTSNGLPVLTFPGEPGLTLTLQGPDGTTLAAGAQYSVAYKDGVYTVTLLDAQPGGAVNPFGTYNGGAATSNPAASADGTYTISARDPAGNTGTVGTFMIDTTPPAVAPTVTSQATTDTTPLITGTATVTTGETFTVTANGVTYTLGDGRLTLNGNNWSLQIPDDQALAASTYSVTARVTDAAGNATSDSTASELVVQQSVKRLTPQDAGSGANEPGDATVTEGGTLRFAVELNAPGLVHTTMLLALAGSAGTADLGSLRFTDGVTYDPVTGLITIPAGISTFAIEVPTTDDPLVEPVETVNLTLAGVTSAGTVVDNDQQSVTRVTPEDALNSGAADGDSTVVEGQPLRYTVNLSAPSATPTRLSMAIGGTANAADLAALSFSDGVTLDPTSGELIVPAGVTSFSVTVPTVDDKIVEGTETATLTVGGVMGAGTIIDNDAQSVTRVAAQDPMNPLAVQPDQQVMEGQPLEFSISLSNPSAVTSTFPLSITGTAAGIDIGRLAFSDGVTYNADTGTVTVPAGVTSFRITVPTIDDSQVELTESVVLTVGGLSSVGLVTDNDRLSVARITPEDANNAAAPSPDAVVEEGGVLRFSVALTGSSPVTTTFPLSLSGTATESDLGKLSFSDGVTYDPATGLLTVPAGTAGFTVLLPTQDDPKVEVTESVRLNIGGLTATGLITDNDTPSIARLTAEDAASGGQSPADPAVVEGQSLRFSVALNQIPVKPVTFPLGITGSAAALDLGSLSFTEGVTYDASTGLITVPAGMGSFNLILATIDDALVETAEDVRVNIGGVPAQGIITDNDQPSVTQVTAEDNANLNAPSADAGVIEGQTLRFAIQLSSASPVAFSLPITMGGTANSVDLATLAFSDGVRLDPATGRLLIPAGVASFAVLVPTVDDTAVETTESVILNVGGVTAVGTITDNDSPSVARVTAEDAGNTASDSPDAAVVEGNNLRFSVALTEAPQRELRLPISWSGSAIASDLGTLAFTDGVRLDPATGELVVPAGVGSFSIIAPTLDDTKVEGTETVRLNVGGLSAAGTILDNDTLFVTNVAARDPQANNSTAADPAVVEGQPLQFAISLSQAPAAAAQIPFGWTGSAHPADLGSISFSDGVTHDSRTGLLTIPAGVAKFTVTVPTTDDRLIESSEAMIITVGGVTASGTILDNDRPAVRSVQAFDAAAQVGVGAGSAQDTTVEEGQPLRYTIELDAAAATTLSLPFSLSGTAVAADHAALSFSNGVKYDPATGSITVPAGVSSFDIIIPTVDDSRSEATESLVVSVDGLNSVGRITDNDRPMIMNARATPGASMAWIKIPENNTPVTVMSTVDPANWVISGGVDSALFSLDPNGNLTFNKAPDYEAPADSTRRNVYELEVTATDVNGNWSRQKISVEVMDVVEAVPLYAAKTTGGDRLLSMNLGLSQERAKSQGSSVDIDFYVMPSQTPGTVPLKAWVNLLTGDLFYAPEGTPAPYACYVPSDSTQLGFVKPVGQGGIAVHLYINAQGVTQMASQALAQKLGLIGQGYQDLGPIFASIDPSVTPTGVSPKDEFTSIREFDPAQLIGTPDPIGP